MLTRYHFLSLWNWRSVYLGRLIEPVAYFAFLAGGISGFVPESHGGYYQFALAGMVCLLAFRAATSALSDVANDRKWGVFAIYSMQGGTPAGYVTSIGLVGLVVFTVQYVVLAILAFLLSPAGVPVRELLWYGITGALVVLGWVGCGCAAGAKVQSYARRDLLVTVTSLPVILAAPLFYSLAQAPNYLRFLARFNPLTYQASWLRLDGASRPAATLYAVIWAAIPLGLAVALLARANRLSTER